MKEEAQNKPRLTLSDLNQKLNLSIPEAMRLTGYSRVRVDELCDNNEWKWFLEGKAKRRRIVTRSIFEYQERKAAECMSKEVELA